MKKQMKKAPIAWPVILRRYEILLNEREERSIPNLLRLGIGEFIHKSRTSPTAHQIEREKIQEIEVMRLAKRNVNLVFTLIVTFKGIVGEDEGVLFEKEADQHHHGHSSNEGSRSHERERKQFYVRRASRTRPVKTKRFTS